MNEPWLKAAAGVLCAIAITTAMDATGYTMFSALPLMPLTALFWYLQKFSRREIGLVWGKLKWYLLASGYPAVVMGLIAIVAFAAGAVDTSDANWSTALINFAAMSSIGTLMVLITEEGFFRGWLWAALKRAGQPDVAVLLWSSVAFTLWHVSAISLDTGFDVPAAEIPIFLTNATIIGGVFGMLRMASGSVLVASVCHAVWNGIAYPLFGFGERVGALGITQTHIFGPEVGMVGVVCNAAFAAALWFWWVRPTITRGGASP